MGVLRKKYKQLLKLINNNRFITLSLAVLTTVIGMYLSGVSTDTITGAIDRASEDIISKIIKEQEDSLRDGLEGLSGIDCEDLEGGWSLEKEGAVLTDGAYLIFNEGHNVGSIVFSRNIVPKLFFIEVILQTISKNSFDTSLSIKDGDDNEIGFSFSAPRHYESIIKKEGVVIDKNSDSRIPEIAPSKPVHVILRNIWAGDKSELKGHFVYHLAENPQKKVQPVSFFNEELPDGFFKEDLRLHLGLYSSDSLGKDNGVKVVFCKIQEDIKPNI